MLPTKGYFQDIECPYYNSVCNRPYCHFRHRKKGQDTAESQLEQEIEVPTYKPTPKSELANIKSHIPISYVPDLAFRPNNSRPRPLSLKPTYKPTPLSILSSANNRGGSLSDDREETTENIKAIKEIKQNIANVEYKPEIALQSTTDINFEELSAEFDLIDDIIDDSTLSPSAQVNENDRKGKSKTHKERDEKSKSSRHKSHRHHKSDTKDRSKDDKKKRKSRERDKERDKREKERNKKRHKSSSKDKKKEKQKKSESSNDDDLNNIELEDDEDETMLECYKIFNEYKPPETEVKSVKEPEIVEEQTALITGKKRISHVNSESNEPKEVKKVKCVPSAAQVMANRFKMIREQQANNEEKHIMNEVKQSVPLKRQPPPSLLEAARTYKRLKTAKSTNIVESIINGNKPKPKRIIPAQNVSQIQKAKAKIDEQAKQNVAVHKTVIHNKKHEKRVAHIPDYSLSNIPDVINADKSKLPINVRTRFLTMIADECVKLYLTKEDAYTRALNEEFQCYEKCKVLLTYKNSAMLSVSRLRKEFQEREKLGLGLYETGECSNKDKSSEFKGTRFYNNIKKYVLSDEELDEHGFPKESLIPGQAVIKNTKSKPTVSLGENQRKCSRCSKIYLVDTEGFSLYQEECLYHPLKKRTLRGEQTYLCCKSNDDTGCATSNTHVCEMSEHELEGYQTTMPPENDTDPRNHSVYALDCEMCYTIKGLELTRVTIVDCDCKIVYESLVKPLNPIIDYNTNFSGITKEQMDKTSTSILQVQANILHLCNSKTVLIGHSLESDMKALKIIHGTIIDTSVLFPHKMGLPHKRALRVLASEFLKKIIQNNINGHDSAEDAISCMELVKWKLKEELKVRGIK